MTGYILKTLKCSEAFCDDLNIMTSKESDLLLVNDSVEKFDAISGAILSRN